MMNKDSFTKENIDELFKELGKEIVHSLVAHSISELTHTN